MRLLGFLLLVTAIFVSSASSLCLSEQARTGIVDSMQQRALKLWNSNRIASCIGESMKSVQPTVNEQGEPCYISSQLDNQIEHAMSSCFSVDLKDWATYPRKDASRSIRQATNKKPKNGKQKKASSDDDKEKVLGFVDFCGCSSSCHFCCIANRPGWNPFDCLICGGPVSCGLT